MNFAYQHKARNHTDSIKMALALCTLLMLISAVINGCGQSQTHGGGEAVLVASSSEPADILGIIVDENMKVLDVERESGAAKGGVQIGDIIEAINDIPLIGDLSQETKADNAMQAKMAIWEPKEGKVVRVQLQREGKVIILEITPAPPAPRLSEATVTPVAPNMDYY